MEGQTPAPAAETPTEPRTRAGRRTRRSRARDGVLLALIALIGGALIVLGALSLQRELYSPTAFVERYLSLLAQQRAADALQVAGVAVDSATLDDAGLPAEASEALLRAAALSTLTDIARVEEREVGDETAVTMSYRAGGVEGRSTFLVERDGWTGPMPAWRFAQSPLAAIEADIEGSRAFAVNGFPIDKRQVVEPVTAEEGDEAAEGGIVSVPLLVLTPGIYAFSIDTAVAHADGSRVLADVPMKNVPLIVRAEPTPEFTEAVQTEVNAFLDDCATQRVLQPTGCPFGFRVDNRIASEPVWSIASYPEIALVPVGDEWRVEATPAAARLNVAIRSLFTGIVTDVDEEVPFTLTAEVSVRNDGSVSILVGGEYGTLD